MELKGFKISVILLKQNNNDGSNLESQYDFSKYAQIGFGQTLNLDDTIDTMSIVLMGLPFRKEFEPTSLFRITISQPFIDDDNNESQFEKVYDYALQQDDVEQPDMSDDNYFIHNLTLCNPAIIAQQRTVDNIAITYKLQDVYLDSTDIRSIDFFSLGKPIVDSANYYDSWYPIKNRNFGNVMVDFWTDYRSYAHRYIFTEPIISYPVGVLSENNPAVEVFDDDLTEIRSIKENYLYGDGTPYVEGGITYPTTDHIEFTVPLVRCYGSVGGTRNYTLEGFLPTEVIITDTNLITGVETTLPSIICYPSKYIVNADEDNQKEIDIWYGAKGGNYYGDREQYRFIYNNFDETCVVALNGYTDDVIDNNKVKNRTIRIDFNANELHTINVKIKRHPMYQATWAIDGTSHNIPSNTTSPQVIWQKTTVASVEQQSINTKLEEDVNFEINFSFSYYPKDSYLRNLFHQSKQIDAYYLFKKSQLAIMPIKKKDDFPYYDSDLPFVVSEADKTLLERTLLIESDFVGKNLWEVFSEIGKYIHAKPKISIETDENDMMTGQFLVSFLQYGKPDINNINATTDSIFNSKFAQEYICELDSYVENYFNLGSYITERGHFTSDSDDNLIYNDVVKIITRYPILEILNLYIYSSDTTYYDATKYVFEYNIYKTLDYDENKVPSKHRAIYYHLGSNIIEGMQFVTPAPTGVECAYSIKNIIGLLFNVDPTDVNVNNYTYKINYRIKDNVRVSITRPDLRKYLLNSDYDSFPIHAQFNQQQEKLVSSDSFGLNAYGKLIRTGNTTYNYYNWTNNINNVMNEGDLYNTADGLYYVSKVNRVYYAEHIEENVELTKDFNRLSQIIGIPSEPRFYEISERNIVNRDIKFNEYIYVSATKSDDFVGKGILSLMGATTVNAIANARTYIPDGVISFFKGDVDKEYDTLSNDSLYQIYTPLVSYSSKTTLTLEWDMEDNFSAGDKSTYTSDTLQWGLNLYSFINFIKEGNSTPQQAYRSKEPVRYVDNYGRADLMDFVFTKDWKISQGETYDLPQINILNRTAEYQQEQAIKVIGGSNDMACWKMRNPLLFNDGALELASNYYGYIIAKDNRERLSFNYNIQMLLDSDRIVLGNKLWIRDLTNTNTMIVLLDTELNKFDSDLINMENIIAYSNVIASADLVDYVYLANIMLYYFFDVENNLSNFTLEQLTSCKAYAIVRESIVNGTNYRLIIGKNVSDIENVNEKVVNFQFSAYDKDSAKTNRKQLDNE